MRQKISSMGDFEEKKRLLQVVEPVNPEDETCRTFVLHKEDHTLGNSLRYMIMKNPETQFCGYSIPHPSEHKINLRIQTHGQPASEILKKGLTDLSTACDHVLKTFETSVDNYQLYQKSRTNRQSEESGMDTD